MNEAPLSDCKRSIPMRTRNSRKNSVLFLFPFPKVQPMKTQIEIQFYDLWEKNQEILTSSQVNLSSARIHREADRVVDGDANIGVGEGRRELEILHIIQISWDIERCGCDGGGKEQNHSQEWHEIWAAGQIHQASHAFPGKWWWIGRRARFTCKTKENNARKNVLRRLRRGEVSRSRSKNRYGGIYQKINQSIDQSKADSLNYIASMTIHDSKIPTFSYLIGSPSGLQKMPRWNVYSTFPKWPREKGWKKKRNCEENDFDFSRCANCSVHCALRTAHGTFVWGRSECTTWLVNHSFEPIRAFDVQINMAWIAEDTSLLKLRFTSCKT